jgi:uncharacterized cofD-like protein
MTRDDAAAGSEDTARGRQWRVDSHAWWLIDPPAAKSPRDLRVVAIGGGTGLPVVLRGLKRELFRQPAWPARRAEPPQLTAIVTVADDGGSSGRLRSELGVPAPGDVRNCLLALADDEQLMSRLFDFRFHGAGQVAGHNLGNLILTALSQIEDGFDQAVEQGGKLLAVCGQVVPCTRESVTLRAEFTDGSVVEGESRIAAMRRSVARVTLEPPDAEAAPEALRALEQADLIALGPGSLYTSVIPPLIVSGIGEMIVRASARVVLVMNLMTEPGETDGYTAIEHIRALQRHVPRIRIDDVVVNTSPMSVEVVAKYARAGAIPVVADIDEITAVGSRCIGRPLLASSPKIRHCETKLARVLVDLAGMDRIA